MLNRKYFLLLSFLVLAFSNFSQAKTVHCDNGLTFVEETGALTLQMNEFTRKFDGYLEGRATTYTRTLNRINNGDDFWSSNQQSTVGLYRYKDGKHSYSLAVTHFPITLQIEFPNCDF